MLRGTEAGILVKEHSAEHDPIVSERVGLAPQVFKQAGRAAYQSERCPRWWRDCRPRSETGAARAKRELETGINEVRSRTGMNIAWWTMPVMGHSSPWAALIGGLFCVV
jgi:hypothetical protein